MTRRAGAQGDKDRGDEAHSDEAHSDEAHSDEAHSDEAHSDEAHVNTTPDPDDADPEDADPGLFRERTELAWQRTGIAFAALGGAVLKTAPVIGSFILASSVAVFVIAHAARPGRSVDAAGRRRSLLMITIAVTAMSLVALAMAVLTGEHRPLPF